MLRLNLNYRLCLAYSLAGLLCGVPLPAAAQLTTLTPAQQQAKANALARQQDAKARADANRAKAQADLAARKQAAQERAATRTGTATTTPQTAPTTSPQTAQARATQASTAATPAKASCGGFFNPCSTSTTGNGGSSVGPDSANRASSGDGFAAGQGRFDFGDHSIVAYGCLRSGTRVFCDFDQFKQKPAPVNAQSAFSRTKLVMNGGRIFAVARSTFVDADGSTYATAQMSPTNAVRLMLEYDDVPESQNVAILSFNNKEIHNVNITAMNLQENGNLSPRASNGQQNSMASTSQQIGNQPAAANSQGTTGKANSALSNTQRAKSRDGSLLNGLKIPGH